MKTPSVPIELERTILKALQKDPAKRHATAAELEIELESAIAATGSSVPLDEVATFVRATLGERDRKRRAAIRDAALKMDEMVNFAPGGGQTGLGPPPPTDSVSGVMLTQTQTPPTTISGSEITSSPSKPSRSISDGARTGAHAAELAAGRASHPAIALLDGGSDGEVTRAYDVGRALGHVAGDATPTRLSDPLIGSSPTLAALAAPGPLSARMPARRTRTAAIAAALACSVGVGLLLVFKLGTSPAPAGAGSTAQTRDPAAATPAPEQRPTPQDAASSALAAPVETTSASSAVGTDIDVSDLPDRTDPAGKRPRAAVGGRRPGALPSARPTASPAAPPPPSTPATGKPAVPTGPTVQDPGF